MREELVQFVQSPDRDNYLAFRAKLIASDAYLPVEKRFLFDLDGI